MSWNYRPLGEEAVITGLPLLAAAGTAFVLTQVFNPLAVAVAAGIGLKHVYKTYASVFIKDKTQNSAAQLLKMDAIKPLKPDNTRDQAFVEDVRASAAMFDLPQDSLTPYFITDDYLIAGQLGGNPLQLIMAGMPPDELDRAVSSLMDGRYRYFGVHTIDGYIMTTPQAIEHFADRPSRMFILGHERAHQKLGDSFALHFPLKLLALTGLRPLLLTTASLMAISVASHLVGLDAAILSNFSPFNNAGLVVGPLRAAAGLAITGTLYGFATSYAARRMEKRADRNMLYATGNLDAAVETITTLEADLPPPRGLSERIDQYFASHPATGVRAAFMKAVWPRIVKAREAASLPSTPKLQLL